jgi:acyl-CoA thioesterase-1
MRLYLLFTALLLNLIANPAVAGSPVVLVVGDSISAAYGINSRQGWVNLLQHRLQQKGYPYTVVNASVSGDTSRNGLTRLPPLLQRYQPEVVIIELGGNDGLQGLPLPQLQDNLEQMVALSRRHDAQVLLAGIRLPPNYGPDFNRRFAAVYRAVAEHYQLAFLPHLLQGVAERPELMQADGIHPQAAGQGGILDNIWPLLEAMLSPETPTPDAG